MTQWLVEQHRLLQLSSNVELSSRINKRKSTKQNKSIDAEKEADGETKGLQRAKRDRDQLDVVVKKDEGNDDHTGEGEAGPIWRAEPVERGEAMSHPGISKRTEEAIYDAESMEELKHIEKALKSGSLADELRQSTGRRQWLLRKTGQMPIVIDGHGDEP